MGPAWLTFGVGSVGDSQGGGVGVDAVRDHAVEDSPPSRNLVTRQQPHDPGVAVVELPKGREDKLWGVTRAPGPSPLPSGDAAAVSINSAWPPGAPSFTGQIWAFPQMSRVCYSLDSLLDQAVET